MFISIMEIFRLFQQEQIYCEEIFQYKEFKKDTE